MSPIRKFATLGLAACLVLPAGASAQRSGELTLYSGIAFRGETFTITGPRQYVRVPFTVRSARVAPGETWEVCTRTEYRGCFQVTESQGNISWTVNSARPVERIATLPAPVAPGAPGDGQSLRGMSAEFFPQPSDNRGRVASCNSGAASCAAEAADRFCQSRGWTGSAHEMQQTVAGRIYLADVLCTRTG